MIACVCVGGWIAGERRRTLSSAGGEESTAADLAGDVPTAGEGSESPPA